MRLGLNRRVKIRIFPAHTAPLWQRANKVLAMCLVVASLSMGFTYYNVKICPMISDIARQRSVQMITSAIDKVISEELQSGSIDYEKLIKVNTDSSGHIQAIYANTREMNKLKSSIAIKLQEEIVSMDSAQVTIPLGALLGSRFFSGAGPKIPVKFVPMGYALVDFESSFSAAGINQTKHQIDIVVSANFGMISSAGNQNIEVKTSAPAAQTIIVGSVPDSYMALDGLLKGTVQGE